MDYEKDNPEKTQDNNDSESISQKSMLMKTKHFKIAVVIVIVFIVGVGLLKWNQILSNNDLHIYMTEYMKEYNFVDSWEITGNTLIINTNDEYDRLPLKTKYEKLDDLYDDFSSALIRARNIKKVDREWIISKIVKVKHNDGYDHFDYSGLITADGKEFDSFDLKPSTSTVAVISSNDTSYYTTPSDEERSFAWVAAKDSVKERLKAPSTAKFPSSYGQDIKKSGANTFIVNSYVDAENSFGAKIRANFSVTIQRTGSDTYIVKDVQIYE